MPMRPALTLLALLLASTASADDTDQALLAQGRQVFLEQAQPSCSLCHALREAGASGAIGPDLDQLKPDAARVVAAVSNGVGVMPPFAETLSDEQIRAVAHYVSSVAGR
ncbi:Cytochrome C oxidase, cbb3-type, subunit III [Pseudomonas linyingensis]|uniref:Cytochrome C oxidase, cbb3-type, subunit III n=1 Tax=Pseudomonas linyingensis TaxID=915471 RepID=A0A1H6S0N1_9PSED|nr:cytochrome c [Pseudomonas linyingensis]SEI60246.1 Cytochrome C oxidase, cbb3-type, subunit III [Pseudomonas linyingensis]